MRIVSSVLLLMVSFLLHGCQQYIPQPNPTLSVSSQSFQDENGLRLVNSSYSTAASNQKLLFYFRSEKQLDVSETRQILVKIVNELFYTNKTNVSLRDLEIWISFLDKKGKHPSKEYIGFATLSDGNLCYRHYDKDRFPYEKFCNYHNETLEEAIQLTKELFSSSKSDHFMLSELEILAKQEKIQPTICMPI